jgi:hypothetical protein
MMAIYQPFVLFPVLGYCTLGILSSLGQIGGFIGVVGIPTYKLILNSQ